MIEHPNAPTVGSIYSRFFQILGQDFGLILRLGIISLVIPGVLVSFVTMAGMKSYFDAVIDELIDQTPHYGFLIYAVFPLVITPLVMMLTAWNTSQLTYLAAARDSGVKPQFIPILISSLRTLPVVLGLGLIVGLAVALGLCLGIVPGIIAGLALGFAIPAYICEPDISMIGALKRSIALTRNHRWTIFLVSFAAFLVHYVTNRAIHWDDVAHHFIWPALIEEATRDTFYTFTALLGPVIYLCLRDAEATGG